jgi:hypothetical protein
VWKVPCAIVLLLPGLPRLKEWAYSGAVFNYSGAFASYVLYLHVIDLGGGSGFSFPLVPSCALTGVGTDTLGQCVGMPGKDA